MFTSFISSISDDQFTLRAFVIGVGIVLCAYMFFGQFTAHTLIPHFLPSRARLACDSNFICIMSLVFIAFEVTDFSVALWAVFYYTLAAFVGLFIMVGSAQLDFVDEGDWQTLKEPFVALLTFFVVIWVVLGILIIIAEPAMAGTNPDLHTNYTWYWNPLVAALLALIALPLTLIAVFILAPPFIPVVAGCVIAAVICLPRAFIFWTTVSKIRGQYERTQDGKLVDGDAMSNALGESSSSSAHARALRKEVHSMTADAREDVERLRKENQALSANIADDTKRFTEEAELSSLMAEAETLRIKNDLLRRKHPNWTKTESKGGQSDV